MKNTFLAEKKKSLPSCRHQYLDQAWCLPPFLFWTIPLASLQMLDIVKS